MKKATKKDSRKSAKQIKAEAQERLDNRPRFGYCDDLDKDPQIVTEKFKGNQRQVALIPLPFQSGKLRKQVREFTKRLWEGKWRTAK
jgi:hypothetical protein